MLKGFFRAGQVEEAWGFFLRLKKRKCEIDVVTYTTLVHGFGVVGEIKRAKKIFDEMVGAGVLPSVKNFSMLNREDDQSTATKIDNPRSADVELVRTSLIPGLLITIGHPKDQPNPIKIFEVGDIALLDQEKDVGARNHRRLAALYCNSHSGFEVSHGLVDRIMEKVGAPFVLPTDESGYYLKPSNDPEFLPGRQASVIYKGKPIGKFGIVHPEILNNFKIPIRTCSLVEPDVGSFL